MCCCSWVIDASSPDPPWLDHALALRLFSEIRSLEIRSPEIGSRSESRPRPLARVVTGFVFLRKGIEEVEEVDGNEGIEEVKVVKKEVMLEVERV